MKLALRNIHLPLSHFPLELDTEIEGGVIAIFGPNGAGKTSLLDLIAGLRKPRTAFIRLDDQILTDTASTRSLPPQQRGIGYVPQDGALFPHLSVFGNITYGARRHNTCPSIFSIDHVTKTLEISHLLTRNINSISGGEKQRVALARALLSQPRLLLLDEPLSSFDEPLKAKGLDLLRRIRAEFSIPILYVSHAPEEITAICDQMIYLDQGKLIRRGPPKDLLTPLTHNSAPTPPPPPPLESP